MEFLGKALGILEVIGETLTIRETNEEYKVLQGGGNSPYQKDNMLHWAPKEQQRLSWQHPYQHFQPATRDPFGVARQAMHFNRQRSSASNGNVHCRFQSARYGIMGQPDELDIITDGCQHNAPMRLHVHRKSVPPAHPASTTLLHPMPSTAHSGAGHISSRLLALYGAVWQPSEYAFGFLSSLCGIGSGYLNSGLRGVCGMLHRPSEGAYCEYLSSTCDEAGYMGSGWYRTSGTLYGSSEGAADDRGSPRPSHRTPTAPSKPAVPAAPKEQKHRYKASVVSRGYRQLMDRDAQVAAQQALTRQEDAEMLNCIADLARAGEEACAEAGVRSESDPGPFCLWFLRDLLLMLPTSSKFKGLLNDDEAILDISAAPEDSRMHLLCSILIECCIEGGGTLLIYMYKHGMPTHACGVVQHLCKSMQVPMKDREELIDRLMCVLLHASMQTRQENFRQLLLGHAASFLILRDALPQGISFPQDQAYYSSRAPFPDCLVEKSVYWGSSHPRVELQHSAVLFCELMTAVAESNFDWFLKQVVCCGHGTKLCCEAYFVLERHERGRSCGKLLGILFLWAEQALKHQPDPALKVLHFAVHIALALQEDTSFAVFTSALTHRPQCALAFAKLELDASKERVFQLSVLRHISDDAADISDAVMLRAALLVNYLIRMPAADFLTAETAHQKPQACLDALRLIWHAVELSERTANSDLDDICMHSLDLVKSLLSSLGGWAFRTATKEPLLDAAAEVLCAAASAQKLVRDDNLHSLLVASMAHITSLCCTDRVRNKIRDAVKKIEVSKLRCD